MIASTKIWGVPTRTSLVWMHKSHLACVHPLRRLPQSSVTQRAFALYCRHTRACCSTKTTVGTMKRTLLPSDASVAAARK